MIVPHPRSKTAKGGNMIQRIARAQLMVITPSLTDVLIHIRKIGQEVVRNGAIQTYILDSPDPLNIDFLLL